MVGEWCNKGNIQQEQWSLLDQARDDAVVLFSFASSTALHVSTRTTLFDERLFIVSPLLLFLVRPPLIAIGDNCDYSVCGF